MKRIAIILAFITASIAAVAQENTASYRANRWTIELAGGVFHPMYYDMKYLVDCSSIGGSLEGRRELTSVVSLGAEVDGFLRLKYKERQDPRTLVGPTVRFNLVNLFGGPSARRRLFEVDAILMPAWGHLYRGSTQKAYPDEDYLAGKVGLDLRFNLGRCRDWSISLKPAIVWDLKSIPPALTSIVKPYQTFDQRKSDLILNVGVSYRFRRGEPQRVEGKSSVDTDELIRLNEIVNYLRYDVEQRDATIKALEEKIKTLQKGSDARQ